MPSLFSRRSRSVSTTRPTTPASNSAHLAAAQAFLASQPSQSNLSASAAAAALRTMSPPPTPVDQVQTKRMLNRQTSNSSITSAPRGRSRGVVQRRPSAGSMTERTFRSPSPGQQASQNAPPSVDRNAPPVPRLPQTYSTEDLPPIPPKSHRRSVSMDTPPARVSSPPLSKSAGTGQSIQSSAVSNSATTAARRSTKPQVSTELQRSDSQDSRNSVNFSYPRGSRPTSPPARSPLASNEALPTTANQGISASEAAQIKNELMQTAAKPVKKKKKRVDRSAAEGSHLHSGTMGVKPTVTPLEPLPADYEQPAELQVVKKPKKKATLTGQSSHFPEHQDVPTSIGISSESDTTSDSPKDKRSQRAAGLLNKQPSVVREDWEGEQEEVEGSSPIDPVTAESVRLPSNTTATASQPKKALPEANMSRKIEDPSSTFKPSAVHNDVTIGPSGVNGKNKTLSPVAVEVPAGRGVSISPSRSTRFSDRLASDLAAGRKHEPMGRSVSPAKSALKHSSISSDTSPLDAKTSQRRGSSVTPSEASDVSTDGGPSWKKSQRVSFEGFTDAKDSLADVRAAKDGGKRSWLGFGKAKSSNLGTIAADEEVEEGMKPRPALPSFGSVRRSERSASPDGKNETAHHETTLGDQTTSSSEASSIMEPPTMDTSVSSDHALGGVLFRESQKNTAPISGRANNEPLPPTVTSVEGTGYGSDTDSIYSDNEQPFHATQAASQRLGTTVGTKESAHIHKDDIPFIAVQPATPGLDESHPGEDWAVDVPGGFPISRASSQTNKLANSPASSNEHTGLGLSETEPEYSTSIASESSPAPLMTIAEEDSDNNSLYSDAAEDLSDLEGDGFGSINAIVESPMAAPLSQRVVSPPESPLVSNNQQRPAEMARIPSWDDTQAHWSGLAQRVRDVNQPSPSVSEDAPATPRPKPEAPAKVIKTKTQTGSTATSASIPKSKPISVPKAQPEQLNAKSPTNESAAYPVIKTRRSSIPKTQGHLRASMRGEPEPVIAPVPAQKTKPRPVSYGGPPQAPKAALQKKHIPPAASSQPSLGRYANDSDSDSSFRKARRSKKPADGKYTMKRSMRSGPAEPERQPAPAVRPNAQSPPPSTDRRPASSAGAKTFRTTMRGSMDAGTPTLRGQPEGKRSTSLFSKTRTAKSPTRPSSAKPSFTDKIKSRVVDSDDEDGPRPTHFKSRFGDSSDEDEPTTFRPVRGIPRTKDESDSTDLDDSSDDGKKRQKPAAAKKLTIVPPPVDQEVVSPPLSPTTAKKRGLWSRLRGKKKEEEEIEPNTSNTISQREDTSVDVDANTSKEETKNAKELGFNSAAERDALIEQTRIKLESANARPQSSPGRPGSPLGKLQRRITPQRILSDSWATPKIPAAVEDRPQTSDGGLKATRPTAGSRQPTSDTANNEGAVYGKSGKKKKFGFLRKAFGLTD